MAETPEHPQDRIDRLVDALYVAEEFIQRVRQWDGADPEEPDEVLDEIRTAVKGGGKA